MPKSCPSNSKPRPPPGHQHCITGEETNQKQQAAGCVVSMRVQLRSGGEPERQLRLTSLWRAVRARRPVRRPAVNAERATADGSNDSGGILHAYHQLDEIEDNEQKEREDEEKMTLKRASALSGSAPAARITSMTRARLPRLSAALRCRREQH